MPNIRQDEKAEEMGRLYLEGFSLSQVGRAFGVSRQAVFKMLTVTRSKQLRPLKRLPFIEWHGARYTLRENGYYARTDDDREYLHRAVWADFHGKPVPVGHDIHHRDHDKTNNDPTNLDCLTPQQHYQAHGPIRHRGRS